jgi:hypothetical protein
MHNVVTHSEYAIDHKDIALGAFLDKEGAFDRLLKGMALRPQYADGSVPRWTAGR